MAAGEASGAASIFKCRHVMKFYLDEDLSPKIAQWVRKHGIACVSAHEKEMVQATDNEQLEAACREKRCLVTRNRNDFIQLTVQFFNSHLAHYGVLIVPHSFPGDKFSLIADALIRYAKKHSNGISAYTIDFLGD